MSAYEQARDAVADALTPIAAYCQRAHETADASDPALAGKFRHVTQLETAVNAVVNYGAAVEAERTKGTEHVSQVLNRIRAQPAFLAAMDRLESTRQLAGTITSHCLPIPDHARRTHQEPV